MTLFTSMFAGMATTWGALGGLWSYNRANYMYDVPLWQNSRFQTQSLTVSQCILFREDVRDLANLALAKMDSYLFANTLKLGIIMIMYYNFDRTDTPVETNDFQEELCMLLFSVTLLTAMFYLCISIWFAMHVYTVAPSWTTKMLVQICRIPIPTALDIDYAEAYSQSYEHNLKGAFRVPFFDGSGAQSPGEAASGAQPEEPERMPPVGSGPERMPPVGSGQTFGSCGSGASSGNLRTRPRLTTRLRQKVSFSDPDVALGDVPGSPGGSGSSSSSSSSSPPGLTFPLKGVRSGISAASGSPMPHIWNRSLSSAGSYISAEKGGPRDQPHSARVVRLPQWDQRNVQDLDSTQSSARPAPFKRSRRSASAAGAPTSIDELLAAVRTDTEDGLVRVSQPGLEPHLKLFKLLMRHWAAYDLLSKVTMEIGTSALLSGAAHYSLFYMRDSRSNVFSVEPQGWACFGFMSFLAWWSTLFGGLALPWYGHLTTALLMLGGPCALPLASLLWGIPTAMRRLHPVLILLQAVWIQLLSWSALMPHLGKRIWVASNFLNVFHRERDHCPQQPARRRRRRPRTCFGKSFSAAKRIMDDSSTPPTTSDSDSSTPTSAPSSGSSTAVQDAGSSTDSEMPFNASKAQMSLAMPLLESLSAILCRSVDTTGTERQLPPETQDALVQELDELYQAGLAAGVLRRQTVRSQQRKVQGFWLCTPRLPDLQEELFWIDPSGREPYPPVYEKSGRCVPIAHLDELLQAANATAAALYSSAESWTQRDASLLARTGGEAIHDVTCFERQFPMPGFIPPGRRARMLFALGVLCVGTGWGVALAFSIRISILAPEIVEESHGVHQVLADRRRLVPVAGRAGATFLEARGRRFPLEPPVPWLAPASLGCDAEGQRLLLADPCGPFLWQPNRSGWSRLLAGCNLDDPLAAADVGPIAGGPWLASAAGLRQLEEGRGNRTLRLLGLTALALDAAPPHGEHLVGMVVLDGELVGLAAKPGGGWKLAGTVAAPVGHRWVALAMYSGRALALDESGAVFELDVATGAWAGPALLPAAMDWRGLCLLRNGAWVALGAVRAGGANAGPGPAEFWRFERPELPLF